MRALQKYGIDEKLVIPQDKRANINAKILYLVTNNLAETSNITPADIFNSYTGDGGLHGLEREDFANYREYSEAKKAAENGQFFTPSELCKFLVDCIRPANTDIVYDLTFGMGNFFNYLPVESNIYGTELDIKAVKIAKYLYPKANLSHEDIRTYKPPVKADIVIGNPPYNLEWNTAGEKVTSQMYFCRKSAEVLKPAGLMAVIVPKSFLADDFFNKSDIEEMNACFNFVVQFDLPANAFRRIGVESFATKVMIFQKRSRYITDREYTLIVSPVNDNSEYIYGTYIKPLVEEKERLAGKLYFEGRHENCIDKDFMFKANKLLFDIKRHPKLANRIGKCESLLHEYLTQKKPEKMSHTEWEKERMKSKDVLNRMKRVLASADKVYRNEKRIVKTNSAFYIKDYSENGDNEVLGSINRYVLSESEVGGYEKLLRRKAREYALQSQNFDDMKSNPKIKRYLSKWSVYSEANDEVIKLTDTQAADTNKLLQKRYGILQYSMGAGKTLCGLAMAQYHLKHSNVRNVFVVSTAIAINNTWSEVLKDYGIDFKMIHSCDTMRQIKDKQIVIITLDMAVKLKRELKKYVKSQSQKIMLVFDESDSISNPYSKRTKAILDIFRRCRYKYLLTGTTTRNNICEIAPQLELIYNNSINYRSLCSHIYTTDKKGELIRSHNPNYYEPIPAYKAGYELFAESHLPKKITVFGIDQKTQDIYNADVLKELLDKTVITKNFEEVTGKKIYEINQITVPFHSGERGVYIKALKEFDSIRRLYFTELDNARKDSMFKILQQLMLLLKICADPSDIVGYSTDEKPTKIVKILELLNNWSNERVAIGVRHVSVVHSYARYIKSEYPDRPVFVITGGETSFKQRRDIVRQLERTSNGILISTQQALSASTNIDFVDKVLLPELHYNNAAMSQYYFRFIRFTSKNYKQVYFMTYENSIESNLLNMVLAKEKLNLFMKNEILEDEEVYERFGVDPAIIANLMSKEYDDDGKVYIRWGEQKMCN